MRIASQSVKKTIKGSVEISPILKEWQVHLFEELWFEAETLTEAIELGQSLALQQDVPLMVTYRSGRRAEITLNPVFNSEESCSGTLSQMFDQNNENQRCG